MMHAEILIVTYRKDFPYLELCLKSIQRFVTGHAGVTVLVPHQDANAAIPICSRGDASLKPFYEAEPPLGFLHHEIMVCRADEICPNADFIIHIDSDVIF